ncbi:glycosyltransferase [Calothrix sp. NIES-3974]|uniref:glycosyltransferase n=1 Tax=Calothrix sp. NIES-3974 TaxID=2005462 RepID=UPI000B5FCA2F|nr:glycosyltransferase [Calothrix sp. NIES-3974]BAZ06829.1 glycosyl transferase family protein [Calothrix sp. NIES-3974]
MKLSLCMIVKNEETALPGCLQSVVDTVDEIVILDTGSTDKTVEIANQFGAQVYHFPWCDDFSAARNQALEYVSGDWVLVLDADETLVPRMGEKIREAIAVNQDYVLINLLRREVGARQSPYSMVSRLFRRHPQIRFSRPYHAIIDDSVIALLQREPDWQIGHLTDVAILHSGYTPSAIASQNKFATAQAIMEKFLAEHPNDSYTCSKLGALYVELGKCAEGIDLLKRGIASKQANTDVMYELHYHLGIAYTRVQDYAQAISHYQAATKLLVYPMLKLAAYNNLGNLYKETGNLTAAKSAYEMAIKIDPYFATGNYNLGMVLKEMKLYTDAIKAYQRALQVNPYFADAYQNLGVTWLKVGNVEASMIAFQKAIALHEKSNPLEAVRLRQGLQEMGFSLTKFKSVGGL